jgi:hypothetical protein
MRSTRALGRFQFTSVVLRIDSLRSGGLDCETPRRWCEGLERGPNLEHVRRELSVPASPVHDALVWVEMAVTFQIPDLRYIRT